LGGVLGNGIDVGCRRGGRPVRIQRKEGLRRSETVASHGGDVDTWGTFELTCGRALVGTGYAQTGEREKFKAEINSGELGNRSG